MVEPMLELVGVTAGYGRSMVLFDVDLTVPKGGAASVMGHNGAGKTTLLRVAVGALLIAHGLQKAFGWWGGPGFDGWEESLSGMGYQHAGILTYVATAGQIAAGVLLVLGLFTPLAAAGALERRLGGPAVLLPADDDLVRQLYDPTQWRVTADEREHRRRSVYLTAKVLTCMLFAGVIVAILAAMGVVFGGVHFTATAWLRLFSAVVLGCVPFCLFGLALGYLIPPAGAPGTAVFWQTSERTGTLIVYEPDPSGFFRSPERA